MPSVGVGVDGTRDVTPRAALRARVGYTAGRVDTEAFRVTRVEGYERIDEPTRHVARGADAGVMLRLRVR